MKAYLYKVIKNNKNYICSKFDNSCERVTIYHEDGNIFQQYWQQGSILYDKKSLIDISETIPPEAIISTYNVGDVVNHVWRPGLCLNIQNALDIDNGEKARAKRELKIIIEKLHEILMYVEPSKQCLDTYGHKIRELLILACTECEYYWSSYIRLSGNTNNKLTTNDFVKLKDKLFLEEYLVKFSNYPTIITFQPFAGWNAQRPTNSLKWYDGYNKTKHDKMKFFNMAKLEYCLNAISAIIIMFCIRYSPYALTEEQDICSKLINEYFSIELHNPSLNTFYIPYLKSVQMASGAFSAPLASKFEKEWNIIPFSL